MPGPSTRMIFDHPSVRVFAVSYAPPLVDHYVVEYAPDSDVADSEHSSRESALREAQVYAHA